MVDDSPPFRAEPDPEFADQLEQVLLERLTAPAGSRGRRGLAPRDEPLGADPGDRDPDVITLEGESACRDCPGPSGPA